MEDNLSKIKERVDIVDLISGYINLQKAGQNFKARCPFHNEKTASFYVSPERQIWHCFGCNLGGSIFDFVMRADGVDFGESLKILASKAGIELKGFDKKFNNERTRLFEANEAASKFFEKQLKESNAGARALRYLKNRGVNGESINSFRLGYAPNSWDSLLVFLRNFGFKSEEIEKAGLAVKKKNGGHYDRFRSRIMFPIVDFNGRIVGFTGRITNGSSIGSDSSGSAEPAKYVNTPQTILYDKSAILYGFDKAKLEIRKKGECILVEGNMDAIMSHQAGAVNCVASSGTALTDRHLAILKRYTSNLNLCFDMDSAGQAATDRSVILALLRGFNVNVISLGNSECKDPAEYVQKHGSGWVDIIDKRKPAMNYFTEVAFKNHDPETLEGKKAITAYLLPLLKSVSNAIEKSHWIAELALVLKVKEEDLKIEMEKISIGEASRFLGDDKVLSDVLEKASEDLLENCAVSLILNNPKWYAENYPKIDENFFSENARLVLAGVKKYLPDAKIKDFFDSLPRGVREKAEIWQLQSQTQWKDLEEGEFEKEILKILFHLKKRSVSARLAELETQIKKAEKEKDSMRVSVLVEKFSNLSKDISGAI